MRAEEMFHIADIAWQYDPLGQVETFCGAEHRAPSKLPFRFVDQLSVVTFIAAELRGLLVTTELSI